MSSGLNRGGIAVGFAIAGEQRRPQVHGEVISDDVADCGQYRMADDLAVLGRRRHRVVLIPMRIPRQPRVAVDPAAFQRHPVWTKISLFQHVSAQTQRIRQVQRLDGEGV